MAVRRPPVSKSLQDSRRPVRVPSVDPLNNPHPRKPYEATGNCDGIAPVDWLANTPERKLAAMHDKLDAFTFAVTIPDAEDRLPNHSLNVCGMLSHPDITALVFTFPACGYLLHGEGFDDFRRGVSPTYAGKPVEPGLFIPVEADTFLDELATLLAFIEEDGECPIIRLRAWAFIAGRFASMSSGWYAKRKIDELRAKLMAPRPHASFMRSSLIRLRV